MRRDLWKEDKQALRALTIDNVGAALDLPGKRWWTVGELAEDCRQRRCGADHPVTGRSSWFDLVPRRVQYLLVEMALRHLKADRCLGSDDGREVRVYAAMVRRPDHGPSLLTSTQIAGALPLRSRQPLPR